MKDKSRDSLQSVSPIYAHPEGCTRLCFSNDGEYLFSVGINQVIRKFFCNQPDREPDNIEHHQDAVTGIISDVCTRFNEKSNIKKDKFITCSEDATVSSFDIESNEFLRLLARTTLPVRDVAVHPYEGWIALASDELTIRLVHIDDFKATKVIRGIQKSCRYVSFSENGLYLAASLADGSILIYNVNTSSENAAEKQIDLELMTQFKYISFSTTINKNAFSKVLWKPNENCFAFSTRTREISVYQDGIDKFKLCDFENGHQKGEITAFSWSPNGKFLISAANDGQIILWETDRQTIIKKIDYQQVSDVKWHPSINLISIATFKGLIHTIYEFIPPEHVERINELSENEVMSEDEFAWIEDDDGAGFVPAEEDILKARKRYLSSHAMDDVTSKPITVQALRPHLPVQQGTSPWKSNRRYLALNLVGHIWSVHQESSHNTVTVEFLDQTAHRKYHFMDSDLFELAYLTDKGALFANRAQDNTGSVILYRAHESWSINSSWRLTLPDGEDCVAIALTNFHSVVCSNNGLIRVFTATGIPIKLFRFKFNPIVTCAASKDNLLMIGNGAICSNNTTELRYSLYNISKDEVLQSGDLVAIKPSDKLISAFFSEEGDPYIYDSSETLTLLHHWKIRGQAEWVPVLNTALIPSKNRDDEYYWPIFVEKDIFNCFVLKGGDRSPYFPRPIMRQVKFQIPFASIAADLSEATRLEEAYLREKLFLSLFEDRSSAEKDLYIRDKRLKSHQISLDKLLLQQMQLACIEERGEKALDLAELLYSQTSREAARKIALHYNDTTLAQKIM